MQISFGRKYQNADRWAKKCHEEAIVTVDKARTKLGQIQELAY